jgi:hypothetical protein
MEHGGGGPRAKRSRNWRKATTSANRRFRGWRIGRRAPWTAARRRVAMFGWSKRERADREIKEITTWVLGQSVVQGSNFPPVGVFESRLQMQVAGEACGFFLHAVDRLAYRPGDDRLREAVYDIVATTMVRTFSEMIFKAWAPSPLSEVEQDTLDFFNIRQLEYGNAARLIGETFNDLNSASWLAAHKVARASTYTMTNAAIAGFKALTRRSSSSMRRCAISATPHEHSRTTLRGKSFLTVFAPDSHRSSPATKSAATKYSPTTRQSTCSTCTSFSLNGSAARL